MLKSLFKPRAKSAVSHKLLETATASKNTSAKLQETSEALSSAANQQSAAVQETVASLSEMRSMLNLTAEHVRQGQEVSQKATALSEDGTKVTAKLQNAMRAIEQANLGLQDLRESFKIIRNKTRVINDIVFKTQLLSFNASIEAARAGQYGRGFSVVAEEVGRLAQTSGKAAREIDSLLGRSQEDVVKIVDTVVRRTAEGNSVVGDVTRIFNDIAGSISVIAETVAQVGQATTEQLSGVEQNVRAMEQIDVSSQDNRRLSEEILKMAEITRTLSNSLYNLIDREDDRDDSAVQEISVHSNQPMTEIQTTNSATVIPIVESIARKKVAATESDRAWQKKLEEITPDDPSFKVQARNDD